MYLLFAGDHYYPCGGYNDFKDSFKTLAEAIDAVQKYKEESCYSGSGWFHIVKDNRKVHEGLL